ncbi:MerR family transcriptional regulator [Desulfitobacterium sp. AusDCA]
MLYTVKEVAELAGVTIKTLHHYHKIGLLLPCEITDAGYRLYGPKELERLQQILFYRELDFSLNDTGYRTTHTMPCFLIENLCCICI